jgi:thioredoxin 1
MSDLINVTKENFDSVVKNADRPVVVDFWAEWCGPCRMLTPILEDVAKELGDKVLVVKVNIDQEPELAQQNEVMSIPTVKIFKDGEDVKTQVGVQPKAFWLDAVNTLA